MFKTEYDLKAIMYPAYDTPHKLCNIGGEWKYPASQNSTQ